MRIYLKLIIGLFLVLPAIQADCVEKEKDKPNVLLIVADDLNYDSPGFAGGVAPDVTPNIDLLAQEGFLFTNAFVTVSVCQPSRQSMLSGLLPHNYGSAGFFPMKKGIPTLPSLLRDAGYLTGNIHKKHHMLPIESFNWVYDNNKLGLQGPDRIIGRNPDAIASGFRKLIKEAEVLNKPFFMVVNSADPHRPFHGDEDWEKNPGEIQLQEPSRIYKPEEVVVPPTLPDIPEIREDLAKYASSVRRLDDTVGECLKVLDDMQKESSTLVIFVSDNGMPFPFGKFDCYLGSNRTPLIVKWPDKIKKPKTDDTHLVSLMDITPTVLELAGLPIPSPMDGKSLVPFLENREPESWRKSIVFLRNEDIYYSGSYSKRVKKDPDHLKKMKLAGWEIRPDHPSKGTYSRNKEMRTYYDGQYGYIYNNWYRKDGMELGLLGAGVPYDGPTINAMKRASMNDLSVKKRYEFFLIREREELYDWSKDPGSNNNLAGNPEYEKIITKARDGMLEWMKSTEDPLLDVYQNTIY